jgi:hypothetical protein
MKEQRTNVKMTITYCPLVHVTSLHFWIMLHSMHWTKLNLLSTILLLLNLIPTLS